jgi:hypothetical protein
MKHGLSWAIHALALPAILLLGTATVACSNGKKGSSGVAGGGTAGSAGNGGEAGSGAGGAAGSSSGGSGGTGSTCTPEKEICDGKDNDCNGMVDDVAGGCQCTIGQTQPCYTGMPDSTKGVGECKEGTQTCGMDGKWGDCTGQVTPKAEDCNNKDDDCNGQVDDMGMVMCGVGACAATVTKCVMGQLQTCMPGMPSIEVCDGIDNNCNQLVDESDPMAGMSCDSGMPGECKSGKLTCTMAKLQCVPNVMAKPETCDGKDNDCNGQVDDNIPGTGGMCSTGKLGVCAAGTLSCQDAGGGNFTIDCYANVAASPEVCNGLDDDCDGVVDQGNPGGGGMCDTGKLGVCQPGTMNCKNGALECDPIAQAAPETCNGVDDNCDGQIDEGNPGGGQPCGCSNQGLTACQNGQVVCNGGPVTYFQETFKDNSKGWTLDANWQIGPAVAGCPGCTGNPDPGQDHTQKGDNGIAGVVLGGPAPTNPDGVWRYLTSPTINTSQAAGSVYLQYWRWLNSDYDPYMHNVVQVSTDNGSTWTTLPYGLTGGCCGVMDAAWTNHGVPAGAPANPTSAAQYPTQFDLTPYKSATMKIRFGYNVTSAGVYTIGSWNLDDILVASAICP